MQQLLLAATKSDAEAAYNKENKEPKQSAKPPHKKTKKAETVPTLTKTSLFYLYFIPILLLSYLF